MTRAPGTPVCTPKALPLIWSGLGGDAGRLPQIIERGSDSLPSVYAVSDLASATEGAFGAAVAEYVGTVGGTAPAVTVDRRLASHWFATSILPEGWERPSSWDPIAGDYRAADGWIRLHTNAPHHRAAALSVLGAPVDRDAVTRAVAGWEIEALEAAVVEAGGCAAAMRSRADWLAHPQGAAVAAEPLVRHQLMEEGPGRDGPPDPARPLAGVRVLDLLGSWQAPSRPDRWPASAPTCCVSIRPGGTSPACCRT